MRGKTFSARLERKHKTSTNMWVSTQNAAGVVKVFGEAGDNKTEREFKQKNN